MQNKVNSENKIFWRILILRYILILKLFGEGKILFYRRNFSILTRYNIDKYIFLTKTKFEVLVHASDWTVNFTFHPKKM